MLEASRNTLGTRRIGMQPQPGLSTNAITIPYVSAGRSKSIPVAIYEKVGWGISALLVAAYIAALGWLSPLPLQDYPAHLARSVVMDDLMFHGGSRFGDMYQYHFLFIPYVLGDLILTFAVELFGPQGASVLWSTFTFLSLPCAVLFYARITGQPRSRRLLLFLLSLYLATDWFFAMGFMSFRLGLAMTLVTLGIVHALRGRWSAALFIVYVGAVALDYLMHLSTAAFLTAAVCSSALLRLYLRTTRLRTEILLAVPLAAVLLWNFLVADGYRTPLDLVENPYTWGTLKGKFAALGTEFFPYHSHGEGKMAVVLAICLMLQMGRVGRKELVEPLLLELTLLTVTFLGMYFVMPWAYADASWVDVRALPLASLFFIFACTRIAAEGAPSAEIRIGLAVTLAALLATAHLISLTGVLSRNVEKLSLYRAVVAAIPPRARVLPVFTNYGQGSKPLLHAGSFATIDRSALIPYEFAGNNGNTVRYFRYNRLPYFLPEEWYDLEPPPKLLWTAVACDYEYLLVTQPFSFHRFGLRTQVVAQNEAAALLKIERQTCLSD